MPIEAAAEDDADEISEAELSEFEQRMALITKTYGTAGAIMEQCAAELPDLPVQVDDLLQVRLNVRSSVPQEGSIECWLQKMGGAAEAQAATKLILFQARHEKFNLIFFYSLLLYIPTWE